MITDMPHGGNEKVDWLHDLKDNFFFLGNLGKSILRWSQRDYSKNGQ